MAESPQSIGSENEQVPTKHEVLASASVLTTNNLDCNMVSISWHWVGVSYDGEAFSIEVETFVAMASRVVVGVLELAIGTLVCWLEFPLVQ